MIPDAGPRQAVSGPFRWPGEIDAERWTTMTEERQEIILALRNVRQANAKQLSLILSKDLNAIQQLLHKMAYADQVVRLGEKGNYYYRLGN